MRKMFAILCGVVLATGCTTAKYDSDKPTLRDYNGAASSHQQYLGWEVKYSLDHPSNYRFSDQQALTAPNSKQVATGLTQSAVATDELFDDSNDD